MTRSASCCACWPRPAAGRPNRPRRVTPGPARRLTRRPTPVSRRTPGGRPLAGLAVFVGGLPVPVRNELLPGLLADRHLLGERLGADRAPERMHVEPVSRLVRRAQRRRAAGMRAVAAGHRLLVPARRVPVLGRPRRSGATARLVLHIGGARLPLPHSGAGKPVHDARPGLRRLMQRSRCRVRRRRHMAGEHVGVPCVSGRPGLGRSQGASTSFEPAPRHRWADQS